MKTMFGRIMTVALAAFIAGCVTPQPTQETRDILVASGFKSITAATPAQQAHLKKLPRGKIMVANRNGKIWYVYPDAARSQIFVGDPNQYQSFRLSYQDEQLTDARSDESSEPAAEVVWIIWGSWD